MELWVDARKREEGRRVLRVRPMQARAQVGGEKKKRCVREEEELVWERAVLELMMMMQEVERRRRRRRRRVQVVQCARSADVMQLLQQVMELRQAENARELSLDL